MAIDSYNVFSTTLTSGATLGGVVDLRQNWYKIYLQVPTMASGNIYIQASPTPSGVFSRICNDNGNTATVHNDFVIASSASQRIIPIPTNGCRFLRVESSSGCTQVVTTYNFICSY